MKVLYSVFLFFVFSFISTNLLAGKKELGNLIDTKRDKLEKLDVYSGNDSIISKEYSQLKTLLDSFNLMYQPNRQYVRSLNFYANYIKENKPKEAIILLQKAERICELNKYDTLKAFITHDLASIYFQKDLINESYSFFMESAKYFKEVNDMPAYAYTLIDIGNVYYRKEPFDLALDYYFQAEQVLLNVKKESDRAWGLALVYDNIGQVFSRKKNFDSSLYYFNKSIHIKYEGKLKSTYYNSYITISDLYYRFGFIDTALNYVQKAIDICTKQNQLNQLAFCYYSYGRKILKRDTAKGVEYFYKSYNLAKEMESSIIIRPLFSLTKYYSMHNNDSALYYGLILYNKSKSYTNFYLHKSIDLLIGIYSKTKNYNEEARFLKLKIDKLEKDNDNKLFKTELANEAERWGKEREKLNETQKRNALIRNFQSIIVFIVLVFSLFLFRAQRKLKKTTKQLEISNKQLKDTIKTKDMMYSIVAHDLRGPVGASLELVKLMDDSNIDAESFIQVLPTMRKSMQETYNLLENLLAWAQINKHEIHLKKEKFKVCTVVIESEKLHHESAKTKDITIVKHSGKNLMVFADKSSVATVLRNLVSNAIKFTSTHGEIHIQSKEKEDFVEISVTDTGVGMDSTTMETIFNKKTTLTKRGTADEKGSGLGLKLCREFVNMNGGEIWVESEVGKGSKFTFTLPKAKS